MKSLERVQKIFKVFKILAQIILVCNIIGCILCTIAIPLVAVFGDQIETISYVRETMAGYDNNITLCYVICGAIESAAMITIYTYVVRFYNYELGKGTPFDETVVTKMRKLGLLRIIISVATSLVTTIIAACFKLQDFISFGSSGLVMGLAFFIISYLLAYGVDVKNIAKQQLQNSETELPNTEIEKAENNNSEPKNSEDDNK